MKNFKKIPEIIIQSKSNGHVIDYKWTPKTMEKLIDPLEGNENLDLVLNQIGHKASMALAAATLEWIYWRFKGLSTKSEDIRQRVEAMWYAIENPENTSDLVFDQDLNFPTNGFIDGPIWVGLMNIRMIDLLYKKGSNFLQNEIKGLILLARHITPKKRIYDQWFENTINKLMYFFPNKNPLTAFSIEDSICDFSSEPVLCREFFFDSSFEYDGQKSKKALANFIANIDFKNNLYCQEKEHALVSLK